MVSIGAKGGGVLLDIGGDGFLGFPDQGFAAAAVQVISEKLGKVGLILGKIAVVLHQVVVQGAGDHDIARRRGVENLFFILINWWKKGANLEQLRN